eukprot:44994_1
MEEERVPLKLGFARQEEIKNNKSLRSHQFYVYMSTFVAYAMSHFSRKCYTNIKVHLIKYGGMNKVLLSGLDTAFMFSYAVGSFFSGSLGDRLYPPMVVGSGLIGSFICLMILVVAVNWELMSFSNWLGPIILVANWVIFGVMQSTGGPVNTAIMGNWFRAKNRGLVFGTWTCHQYVGNIVAALVASAILMNGLPYTWAVIIPALANLAWGINVWATVPARPEQVGMSLEGSTSTVKSQVSDDRDLPPPISFMDALKIPSVISYALAFGFFKLVNYVLFFWLPFLLTQHFVPSTANIISTLYDIGMMPGGIIVGVVSDIYGGRRACVIITFLVLLCPLLYVISEYSDTLPVVTLLILLGIMGILVGGPNNIISSAVAADLAAHPSIKGNNRALGTVTGIINGSGSITAALGLQAVVPLQTRFGWPAVWYFLIAATLFGCLLMLPKVFKELSPHHHKDVDCGNDKRKNNSAINSNTSRAV